MKLGGTPSKRFDLSHHGLLVIAKAQLGSIRFQFRLLLTKNEVSHRRKSYRASVEESDRTTTQLGASHQTIAVKGLLAATGEEVMLNPQTWYW